MDVTTTRWLLTIGFVAALLSVDLGLAVARPHAVSFRESLLTSIAYIAVALAFGGLLWMQAGSEPGLQFLTGYLVEKSLSVDNLFVFVIIIAAFAVPAQQQKQALVIGIALALAVRSVAIALGATLLEHFSFAFLIFGGMLLATAVQLYRHRNADPQVTDNPLVRVSRRVLRVTDGYRDGHLIWRIEGRLAVTPLFLVLVAIGTTDILFALDSIPAIFGVTEQPYIVFCANAFALLGLRALYFLVSGLLDRLIYLAVGLSAILGFIGVKLILHWGHGLNGDVPQISTTTSLSVIVLVLGTTTAASIVTARRHPELRAHAGALTAPDDQARQHGSPPTESTRGS